MSFTERLAEIRGGFKSAFWVANFSELFERLAYYATSAVLAIYLSEQLHFSKEVTGWMMGTFGCVVWMLPVLGGTLADRFGFRRALMFAYLVMSAGYFLLGSLSKPWMHAPRQALGDKWLVLVFLLILAMGPGMVKPCVVGTTARASSENVRSIGYSIYFTLVSVGATIGPVVAWLIRKQLGWGMENVFRVSALSVFLMFLLTAGFFREPDHSGERQVASIAEAIRNIFVVLRNFRLVLFLLIYSSFFVVYWQEFISAPLFLRGYVDPNANVDLVLSVDALAICCFQIPTTYLTRKIPTFAALTLGLMITSLAWLILAVHPSTLGLVATLVVVALGEVMQSPRYFEYISRLAPPGRQGLYMGCSFLPIAIGYFVAGPLGAYLLHEFGDVLHRPRQMWWVVTAIGLVGAVLTVTYDRVFKPSETRPGTEPS
jgi:dipeptide/tripeptide permease